MKKLWLILCISFVYSNTHLIHSHPLDNMYDYSISRGCSCTPADKPVKTKKDKEKDKKVFAETGICRQCDLSGFDLRDIIKQLRKKNKNIKIDLSRSNLDKVNLQNADLYGAQLRNVFMSNAQAQSIILNNAVVSGEFDDTIFDNAQFEAANVALHNASLKNIDAAGARVFISHCNCERADFKHANVLQIRDSQCKYANFQKARMTSGGGRRYTNNNFESADFENVNLYGAELSESNFSHASMRGAHLEGACIYKTNFTHTDLSFARLKNLKKVYSAILDSSTKIAKAKMGPITYFILRFLKNSDFKIKPKKTAAV